MSRKNLAIVIMPKNKNNKKITKMKTRQRKRGKEEKLS